jgi:hypothetical protein
MLVAAGTNEKFIRKLSGNKVRHNIVGADLTDLKLRIEGLRREKRSASTMARARSNSTWAGGELASNFRKPFDLIAVSKKAYQRKKATNPKKSDLFDIWRATAYRNE